MESDPTERINSVHSALLGILQELPEHEVCIGPPPIGCVLRIHLQKFKEACKSIGDIISWITVLKRWEFPNPEDNHQMELLRYHTTTPNI